MKFQSWVSAPVLIVVAGSLLPVAGRHGRVAGGVTGGLLARRDPIAGAVIGAVAGGIVGGAIGKSLDDEERRQLALASQLAADQPVVPHAPPRKAQWKSNPYQRPDGTTCREVTQSVDKNGHSQSQE